MASLNLNWFFDNWFQSPPAPNRPPPDPPFASFSIFRRKRKPRRNLNSSRLLDQFFWECQTRPDYRHTPEVDRILTEDPVFDQKIDPTPQEIEENNLWWEGFRQSPVVQFLRRCENIDDARHDIDLKKNKHPIRKEIRELWEKLPKVAGPDGRPMPRKAIKTWEREDDKFWDWAKQFFFGLWRFHQRPYPPGKPIDVMQAIGPKKLENRYYDFFMKGGGIYYKDRLGRTRGPLELITLKTAWAAGVIDKHTFIWGEDMDEWAPIGMVYGLEKAIATWEVRLGAASTAVLHKLKKGIPPWTPLKGFEKKTYKQLQDEAIESKQRDMAVLKANNGLWPGVKIPSHVMFLWASGAEMTTLLEEDHMPNKFIPKDLRYRLAKVIPGLRPRQVLSLEQAMDQITYNGEWYREPLCSFTTHPPHIRQFNKNVKAFLKLYHKLNFRLSRKLKRNIPGFDIIMEKVKENMRNRISRQKKFLIERKVAKAKKYLRRNPSAKQ